MRRDSPFAQVVVPVHKSVDTGTLDKILEGAELTVEQFIDLLETIKDSEANLAKKYLNLLKPDSAMIVYQLFPPEYQDPDVPPNPIAFKVEIRDKDQNLVYGPRDLTNQEQKNQILFWDGRDNGGKSFFSLNAQIYE